MMNQNRIAVFAIIPLLLLSCTLDQTAGNGSQTGNPMIAGVVYKPDGTTPAGDAAVFLRKKCDLTDITGLLEKGYADSAITRTGKDGQFTIDSIDTGVYIVECADGGNSFALIDSVTVRYFDSTVVLSPVMLKPAGAIKGTVRLSEGGDPLKVIVVAPDLNRFVTCDSSGTFTLKRIPEGNYTVKVIPTLDDYGVFDTMNVPVVSADTTNIGTISPPYRGIPVPRRVTISYDTLKQQVTLHWNRPSGTVVKSFNVHRRDIDPTTALFTQLNSFPIIDTVYIDSLCEPGGSYEYRVTAVDSNASEGMKSAGATVTIALYPIVPENVAVAYDTLRQTIKLQWDGPDAATVTGFNVYRRNIDLGESFWTPFNKAPIDDTCFIDSTFNLCPDCDPACDDSLHAQSPTYEYCVAAIIENIREGARGDSVRVKICLDHVTPGEVNFSYDTLRQAVRLRWRRPDTTLVKECNVYRRNCGAGEKFLSRINGEPLGDTIFTDTTGVQNQTYEYRIASVVGKNRAEVKSASVRVLFSASFIAGDSLVAERQSGEMQMIRPNDIAVTHDGDVYIADQGNNRITVVDSSMVYKRNFGGGILRHPFRVSVDERGIAFVADYDAQTDGYSIFVFDTSGAPIDTLHDSTAVYDLDAGVDGLYVLTEGRFVSIRSRSDDAVRSWQMYGQDWGKWIIAADPNETVVGTGFGFPDRSRVIGFDSLGTRVWSMAFSDDLQAVAFDEIKRLLYVVCSDGMLHVFDENGKERASYKIRNDDPNISMAIHTNGTVFLSFRREGKILRLNPLFQ